MSGQWEKYETERVCRVNTYMATQTIASEKLDQRRFLVRVGKDVCKRGRWSWELTQLIPREQLRTQLGNFPLLVCLCTLEKQRVPKRVLAWIDCFTKRTTMAMELLLYVETLESLKGPSGNQELFPYGRALNADLTHVSIPGFSNDWCV